MTAAGSPIPGQVDIDGRTEPVEEWRTDRNGRLYLPRPGGGLIWARSETETPAEARVRDQLARGVKETAKQGQRAAGKRGPGRPRGKGRRPDPTPPGEKSAPPQPARATPAQLAAALEIPLLAPMLYARYVWECDYCAAHFKAAAPGAAHDLVTAASSNEYLLRALEGWQRIVAGVLAGGRFPGLSIYAGIPFLHHLAPEQALNFIGPMAGIPPRPAGHDHKRRQPGPARAETVQPEPGAPVAAPDSPVPATPAGLGDIANIANRVPDELRERLAAGDPEAHRELADLAAHLNGDQPTSGGVVSAAEAARAREIALMQEREQLRAEAAQAAAYEQMARQGTGPQPNHPPYSARNGDPQAPPPPDGASSAGSPLPPEAEA